MMKKYKKISIMLVFVLLTLSFNSSFADIYPTEDMDITYSENQFLNPGFESDNNQYLAISTYYNIDGATRYPNSTTCVVPYDTSVYHSGSRSLKVKESALGSFIDIMRIKDYYSSGTNIRGAYEAGYKKFTASAYFKNTQNLSGVKVRFFYENSGGAPLFICDSEVKNITGTSWTKIEHSVDLSTITATEDTALSAVKKGDVFDPSKVGTGGTWKIRFAAVGLDSSVLCEYNIDDIEIKYEISSFYKYENLVEEGASLCEDLTGFDTYKKENCASVKSLDKEIYHSAPSSVKAGGAAWDVMAGFKPTKKLVAGRTYRLSAWIYSTQSQNVYARYAYENINKITGWIPGNTAQSQLNSGVNEWKKIEFEFVPEENMLGDNLKYIYFTASQNYDIYFDDISLVCLPNEETYLKGANVDNGDVVVCDKQFTFTFNNRLNTSLEGAKVFLNGNVRSDALVALFDNQKTVTVDFMNTLIENMQYSIDIEGLCDFWGREIQIEPITFKTEGEFKLNYSVKNESGDNVSLDDSLEGEITLSIDAKNYTLDKQGFAVCFAEYNKKELVEVVNTENVTLKYGEVANKTLTLNVAKGNSVKLFIFESFLSLKPHMNIVSDSLTSSGLVAQYVIDDISAMSISYDNISRPSGWDVQKAGGTLTGYSESFVLLDDTSTTDNITMEKEFDKIIGGYVTFETSFNIKTDADDISFEILGDNDSVIKIVTYSPYLCYEGENGSKQSISGYSVNTDIGLKMVLDLDNKDCDIYVNGNYCVNLPFKNDVEYINKVAISTPDKDLASASIAFVKMHKNYIVNESFSTTLIPNVPDGWTKSGEANTFKDGSNTDIHLKLNNGIFKKEIESEKNNLCLSYKFLLKDLMGITLNVGDGISIVANDGKFSCNNNDFYSYINNIWYQVDIEIDKNLNKAKLMLNGKQLANNIELSQNSKFDYVEFISDGEAWIDDILVLDKKPSYKVPEIENVSNDDYIVGMQTYYMWREGTHYGWDRISPYPERKPYLGWYTDGSSQVSDWEIKWMKEHGIDYEIFPWARNPLTKDKAIKRPMRSDALHDGFFNAKNSSYMKFSLMWGMISSSTLSGSEDFRNNVVPYWMEYYFKDPRYMLIDNKPVISIYDYKNLITVLGSASNVKAEFDYLRQACIDAGFDGIYLSIITDVTFEGDILNEIYNLGADAVYAYHWFYGSNTSTYQKKSIEKQIESASTEVIPYVSMGWNPQPWTGMPGDFCSLDDYKDVLLFCKDKVDTLNSEGSMPRKHVIVGNWNEYGEGHFMMPSNVNGFGYLDAVRSVFTTFGENEHSDIVPTQDEINSMGYLYMQNRVGEKVVPDPEDISAYTTVVKEWNFNSIWDSLSWTSASVNSLSSLNGALSGTSTGIDPLVHLKNDISVDLTDADYVKVRMRLTDSTSCSASVMFKTAEDNEWGSGKYISFGVYNEGYYDYYVFMKANSRWKGTLKNIRIDPMESTGKFEIDSIQILKKP